MAKKTLQKTLQMNNRHWNQKTSMKDRNFAHEPNSSYNKYSDVYKFINAVAHIKDEILHVVFMTIICTVETGNFQVHEIIILQS